MKRVKFFLVAAWVVAMIAPAAYAQVKHVAVVETEIDAQSYQSPAQTYQPSASTPTSTSAPTSQSLGGVSSGMFTDSRDGKKYKTAVIGGKTWMAENLNYKKGKSWCYNNDNSYCNKYGRLYDWNTAKTVCPAGWHLPSRQEWDNLVAATGGKGMAGKKLKSTSGWNSNGNGTDDYGFSALPGGLRYSAGSFYSAGYLGYWWTATEDGGNAYYRLMDYYYDGVYEDYDYEDGGYSARCVKD